MFDLSNYTTEKGLEHAAGVDTSNLAAKKIIALKAEVDKLDIQANLANVPTAFE